jgi:hypothetical protein
MSLTFSTNIIAVFRPTHKEYDFLQFDSPRHSWSLMSPPTVEGIHKDYPHVLAGRETFLQFWNTTGRKELRFHVLGDILKLAGPAAQNVWIPVIRLNRGASYHNSFNKIKKNTLVNIVAPAGTQVGRWNEVAPVPVPAPVPAPAPSPSVAPPPVPSNTLRTPVIIPSNLPRSMIPHFKEVAQNIDKIITNNSISTQEKASQIMNRFARSIREVIKTVEREKTVPKFVAQLVAQHSVENGEMCPITCDDITVDEAAVTSCYHVFSKESIEMYREMGNTTCPVCRQECSVTSSV